MNLTDEQRAFVEAIRDFAKRECGTREQRDALTENGPEPHNREIYAKIAELGWLGAAIPEEYGGTGGGSVDLCLLCEEFSRGQIPMGFFPVTMMSARPVELFGTDTLKEEILPGIVARHRLRDRDVRARGRVGRRQPLVPGRARQRRLRDQRAEDLDHRRPRRRPHPARVPHLANRRQARGADDDLGAAGTRRAGDPRDRHDGRARGQRHVLHRLPRARASGSSAVPTTPGCS